VHKPKWAYGITTVPGRADQLLPRTIKSLDRAGFGSPRLFVDGINGTEGEWMAGQFGLEVTARYPAVRTFGNWALALWELYLRDPEADRYALFQDDLVTYRHLRDYLNTVELKERTYWNLLTFPMNEKMARPGVIGFYPSNQKGLGALALVFSRQGVQDLLTARSFVQKCVDAHRGYRNLDGAIQNALVGPEILNNEPPRPGYYTELVHNPSLVQHTGNGATTLPLQKPHPLSSTFRGEDFDAREMICSVTPSPAPCR
jgi:hypothetical protein